MDRKLMYYTPDREVFGTLEGLAQYYNLKTSDIEAWRYDPKKAVEEACTRYVQAKGITKKDVELLESKILVFKLLCATTSVDFATTSAVAGPYLRFNSEIPAVREAGAYLEIVSLDLPLTWKDLTDFLDNQLNNLSTYCVGLGLKISDEDTAKFWETVCKDMDTYIE